MLIGALPLGFAFYFVFVPPAGLGETALFFWLTGFVLLTRVLMTFFFYDGLPSRPNSTDDYAERTSVMSFRFAIGWLIGISFPLFGHTVLMPSTAEHPIGQLDGTHYPAMALCVAFCCRVQRWRPRC